MDAHQSRYVSRAALFTSPRCMHVSAGIIISKKQPFYFLPVSLIVATIIFIWHIDMKTGRHQVVSRSSMRGK